MLLTMHNVNVANITISFFRPTLPRAPEADDGAKKRYVQISADTSKFAMEVGELIFGQIIDVLDLRTV